MYRPGWGEMLNVLFSDSGIRDKLFQGTFPKRAEWCLQFESIRCASMETRWRSSCGKHLVSSGHDIKCAEMLLLVEGGFISSWEHLRKRNNSVRNHKWCVWSNSRIMKMKLNLMNVCQINALMSSLIAVTCSEISLCRKTKYQILEVNQIMILCEAVASFSAKSIPGSSC